MSMMIILVILILWVLSFLLTLKPEEFARLFVKLQLDAAEENDWIEWMNMPCKKEEWGKILT